MFTGLVEEVGIIEEIEPHAGGRRIVISAPVVVTDLAIGDSVNVSGCCQTVVAVEDGPASAQLDQFTLLFRGDARDALTDGTPSLRASPAPAVHGPVTCANSTVR